MSQVQTITVTRTCDLCSKVVTLTQPVTPDQLEAATGWYTLIKEHILGDSLQPLAKLACSKPCALALLNHDALELPTMGGVN